MSGSEWVAVFAAQACLVALVALVVVIVRLDRAAKDLRKAALDFRAEAEPALAELRERRPDRAIETNELDRVDAIVSGAERVGGRVDAASDLAYRTFTNPVVKALAVGTGTRRAVQRLKGNDAKPKRERKAS